MAKKPVQKPICDADGCDEVEYMPARAHRNVLNASKVVVSSIPEGWTEVDGKHFCGGCKNEITVSEIS